MGMISHIDFQNKAELPSAIFLFGEEEFLIEEALNYVIKKHNPDHEQDYNFYKKSSDELSVIELLDLANAFPMLGDKQTIIVKNFQNYFKGRIAKADKRPEQLISYLSNPQVTTKLIMIASGKGLKTKAPFKDMINYCDSLEFEKVWPNQYPEWIKRRFKEFGKDVTDSAVRLIIAQTQESLRDIANQVEKIITYLPNVNKYEDDQIVELVGQSKDWNVFELQKAVSSKKIDQAMLIAENMLSASKQEILIITVLTNYFKSVFKLFEIARSESNKFELAKQLGVSPFFVNDYKLALNFYSPNEVENIFLYLKDADLSLKTSASSGKNIISKLLMQIIGV